MPIKKIRARELKKLCEKRPTCFQTLTFRRNLGFQKSWICPWNPKNFPPMDFPPHGFWIFGEAALAADKNLAGFMGVQPWLDPCVEEGGRACSLQRLQSYDSGSRVHSTPPCPPNVLAWQYRNIEKITAKNEVWDVLFDQISRKKGGIDPRIISDPSHLLKSHFC